MLLKKYMKRGLLFSFAIILFSAKTFTLGSESNINGLVFTWIISKKEIPYLYKYEKILSILEKNARIKIIFAISPQIIYEFQTKKTYPYSIVEKFISLPNVNIVPLVLHEPILPCINNTANVKKYLPQDIAFPNINFSLPQDVNEQVMRSLEVYEKILEAKHTPLVGIVPPYGAIDKNIVESFIALGLQWTIVPETILPPELGYLPIVKYQKENKKIYLLIRNEKINNIIQHPNPLLSPSDIVEICVSTLNKTFAETGVPFIVLCIEGDLFFSTTGEDSIEIIENLLGKISSSPQIQFLSLSEVFSQKIFIPNIKDIPPATFRKESYTLWFGAPLVNYLWESFSTLRELVESYQNSGYAETKTLEYLLTEIYQLEYGEFYSKHNYEFLTEEELMQNYLIKSFYNHMKNIYSALKKNVPVFAPLSPSSDENTSSAGEVATPSPKIDNEKTKIFISTSGFTIYDKVGDVYSPAQESQTETKGTFDIEHFECRSDTNGLVFTFYFIDNTNTFTTLSPNTLVNLYIDINNRIGAGITQLLPEYNVYSIQENAWEYFLSLDYKSAKLNQIGRRNEYKTIFVTNTKCSSEKRDGMNYVKASVNIPKEKLYGNFLNWSYLLVTILKQPSPEKEKTLPIKDLILPSGSDEKEIFHKYRSTNFLELPFVKLQPLNE
jgi:hypothetical protein